MIKKPNFFIIGAPKCGTTSLVRWLELHPNIYISPNKEPRYFDRDLAQRFRMTEREYLSLFSRAENHHLAIGEATVWYLYSNLAVPTIEKEIGQVRYIVLVRNPVDMAYSLHEQFFIDQIEPIADFEKAFKESSNRRVGKNAGRWIREPRLLDYQAVCNLGSQLERLTQWIPPERLLILLLDDIKKSPRIEYLKVLNFLGLPDDGLNNFQVFNPAKRVRSATLQKLIIILRKAELVTRARMGLAPKNSVIIRALNRINKDPRKREPLPAELRCELELCFESEIKKLGEILKRDLSHWLQNSRSLL